MDLKSYLAGLSGPERRALAERCGTSFGHLNNVRYGIKPCAVELAIALERESGGTVRCEDLRPDVDWAYIRGTAPTSSAGEGASP